MLERCVQRICFGSAPAKSGAMPSSSSTGWSSLLRKTRPLPAAWCVVREELPMPARFCSAHNSAATAAGERDIDARSDLYSLGVVAYEMATGELPFQAPTVPGILMKHISEPAPDIKRRRADIPDDLAASIMRCLEKDPTARWPTAESLRRALESRSGEPYRPPSPAPRSRRVAASTDGVALELAWARGERHPERKRERRPAARRGSEPDVPSRGSREPEIVRTFRAEFAKWAGVSGALMLVNVGTDITHPWFLLVAGIWGFGLASRYGKLWQAGYSWRDVINRPPAPDAVEARSPQGAKALRGRSDVGADEDFGTMSPQIDQMRRDQAAVRQIVERLPASRAGPAAGRGAYRRGTRPTGARSRPHAVPDGRRGGSRRPGPARRPHPDAAGRGGDDHRVELLDRQRGALQGWCSAGRRSRCSSSRACSPSRMSGSTCSGCGRPA